MEPELPPHTLVYEPLCYGYFRLLEWQPQDESGGLVFSLKIYSRDSAPEYVALSYQWGEKQPWRDISINEQRYYAQPNLLSCLQHLRKYRDEWPRIWIDAICINQADEGEKNQEIRQMTQTYADAKTVVAWLGRNDDQHVSGDDFKYRGKSQNTKEIVRLPYWSRTWIIQEVRLAKDVQCLWGVSRFSWKSFRPTADSALRTQTLKQDFYNWDIRWKSKEEPLPYLGFVNPGLEKIWYPDGRIPLGTLLRTHSRCECSKAEDRIIGMMGIIPEAEQEVLNVLSRDADGDVNVVFPDVNMAYEKVMLIAMAFLKQDYLPKNYPLKTQWEDFNVSWRLAFPSRIMHMEEQLWTTLSLLADKYLTPESIRHPNLAEHERRLEQLKRRKQRNSMFYTKSRQREHEVLQQKFDLWIAQRKNVLLHIAETPMEIIHALCKECDEEIDMQEQDRTLDSRLLAKLIQDKRGRYRDSFRTEGDNT